MNLGPLLERIEAYVRSQITIEQIETDFAELASDSGIPADIVKLVFHALEHFDIDSAELSSGEVSAMKAKLLDAVRHLRNHDFPAAEKVLRGFFKSPYT